MTTPPLKTEYNFEIVRLFTLATIFWGIVGFAAGIFIALQMAFPVLNIEPYLSFGRLRPIHTSAVIFAFGGNALFATSYYVVQKTCGVRLWNDTLSYFTFWGYQIFIVLAATGYLLGVNQSKEYAEPE
jgi:cytochrome c oxidase cbb3-type subunit 1